MGEFGILECWSSKISITSAFTWFQMQASVNLKSSREKNGWYGLASPGIWGKLIGVTGIWGEWGWCSIRIEDSFDDGLKRNVIQPYYTFLEKKGTYTEVAVDCASSWAPMNGLSSDSGWGTAAIGPESSTSEHISVKVQPVEWGMGLLSATPKKRTK